MALEDARTPEELKAHYRVLVETAREGYRRGIADVLAQLQRIADEIEPAIGEVSGGDAADVWRREALKVLLGRPTKEG